MKCPILKMPKPAASMFGFTQKMNLDFLVPELDYKLEAPGNKLRGHHPHGRSHGEPMREDAAWTRNESKDQQGARLPVHSGCFPRLFLALFVGSWLVAHVWLGHLGSRVKRPTISICSVRSLRELVSATSIPSQVRCCYAVADRGSTGGTFASHCKCSPTTLAYISTCKEEARRRM